jgi:hypothetical protein
MDLKRGENKSSVNETRDKRKGGIRTVLPNGEYIVLLVSKGGAKSGLPVG